jgi:hypothetical protein
MRIAALAIGSHDARTRTIAFRGGLNIITGWSATGKSSVLDIVEFCLGRSHPTYAAGVLTQAVSRFAVEVEHEDARLVAVRPAPPTGSTSTSAAILHGVRLADLDIHAIEMNADVGTIRAELTQMLRVMPNQVRPAGPIRPALEATVAQALFYCFQAQDEIASTGHLFHRADEPQIAETVRDTLPFFLGASDADTAAAARQLRRLSSDLRRTEALLRRAREASDLGPGRANELLAEALAVGLTADTSGADAVATLRAMPLEVSAGAERPLATRSEIAALREQQSALLQEVAALATRSANLTSAARSRTAYGFELEEQGLRLAAIDVVESSGDDAPACPLCGNATPTTTASVDAIRRHLADVAAKLDTVRTFEPIAESARAELEQTLTGRQAELRRVDRELRALTEADAELTMAADVRRQQAYVAGRIAEFLLAVPPADDTTQRLEASVASLMAEIEAVEGALDPAGAKARADSMLRLISQDVTAWAGCHGLGERSRSWLRGELRSDFSGFALAGCGHARRPRIYGPNGQCREHHRLPRGGTPRSTQVVHFERAASPELSPS